MNETLLQPTSPTEMLSIHLMHCINSPEMCNTHRTFASYSRALALMLLGPLTIELYINMCSHRKLNSLDYTVRSTLNMLKNMYNKFCTSMLFRIMIQCMHILLFFISYYKTGTFLLIYFKCWNKHVDDTLNLPLKLSAV